MKLTEQQKHAIDNILESLDGFNLKEISQIIEEANNKLELSTEFKYKEEN